MYFVSLKNHLFYFVNKISLNKRTIKTKQNNIINNKKNLKQPDCAFSSSRSFLLVILLFKTIFHLELSFDFRGFPNFICKAFFLIIHFVILFISHIHNFFWSFVNNLGLFPRKIRLWQVGVTKPGVGHLKCITKKLRWQPLLVPRT